MTKATISKEEILALEKIASFEGDIQIIEKSEEIAPAIEYLSQFHEVGFDTETKPAFTRNCENDVALIQISSLEKSFLFRVCMTDFSEELIQFLENPSILKIGLSLQNDIRAIRRKSHGLNPGGFVDLQKLCPAYGIKEQSLRSIYAILYEERMSKQARLTNWEKRILPEKAIQYAALDAYSCLRIYYTLLQLPTPEIYRFGLMNTTI